MFVHGLYHLRERRVACRNDHCMTCGAAQLFLGMRSIRVYHVFFFRCFRLGGGCGIFVPFAERTGMPGGHRIR